MGEQAGGRAPSHAVVGCRWMSRVSAVSGSEQGKRTGKGGCRPGCSEWKMGQVGANGS